MAINVVWFVLLVVLFIGYVVLDGFDLGVGMIYFEAEEDKDRRLALNAIGPVWDANEVWLITAGGALFAAFPDVYATIFSGFYTALMLLLLVLIGRAVSIEFRSKRESAKWRSIWDAVFSLSNFLITLLMAVAFANVIAGLPIGANKEYAGTFWTLISPYSVFFALAAIITLRFHGRLYLSLKVNGKFKEKIKSRTTICAVATLVSLLILNVWTFAGYPHTLKNFSAFPLWYLVDVLVYVAFILAWLYGKKGKEKTAFLLSSVGLGLLVALGVVAIYPNLAYSSLNPDYSLTIFNASSSPKTLWTMFVIACIGVPLALIYKVFVYRTFKGKTELDENAY